MRLLYILSGKNGITSFTFKELELLEQNGVRFILLFTKFQSGNLDPKANWEKIIIKNRFLLQFLNINGLKILLSKAFYSSLIKKEVKYYLVAHYFSQNVPKNVHYKIHVQMGDHKLIIGHYLREMLFQSKLSTTIHAHELYSKLRYCKENRFKFLLNDCSKIFTISNFNREILINDLKIQAEKVELMYLYPSFNYIDIRNKIKILMTGNWEKKKGYEDVFDAIEKIERNDYILLVAGKNINPQDDLDLSFLVRERNLGNKVLLLSHVNKNVLAFLYSYCDLFLLPSKTDYWESGLIREREGLPVSLLEAMSYGLPVISTYHAGIPEAVKSFLIEEGNINELISTLNYALDNIDEIKINGLENIDLINKKFNFNNIKVFCNYFFSK